MLRNWKRNSKKYIAGILTIALTAGVCQSYGSMEAMAKEATLPGIEKLVDDTINTEGNIFHILEVVPSTENASIGYLIGGEEPVSEGRKLSELPSATERLAAMQQMQASINSGNMSELAGQGKALDFSAYEEKENAAHTVQLRGDFVRREDGSGRYNYISADAVYTMLADGEEYTGTRYERYSSFAETNAAIAGKKSILPTFSMVSGSTGNQLQTVIDQNGEKSYAYTTGRYALTNYEKVPNGRMDSIDTATFQAADYVGMKVWQKSGSTENPHYIYLGVIALGASLPEDCTVTGSDTPSVSSGNAVGQSVSGGNAMDPSEISTQQLPEGIAQNLYVLDKSKNSAALWALYNENLTGGVYSFQPVADGYFLQFVTNEAGEYYVSDATLYAGVDSDWKLVDDYRESDTGRYKKVQDGNVQVLVRGENGFDPLNTYDFIGDAKADSLGNIVYNGGFENREWFKKYVLNLSDDEISRMQIEVTTLTVQELADLAEKQTYCGLNLADVDMVYLSGQGTCGAEPENAAYLANAIARLCFGIESDSDTAQNRNNSVRIPVVMDYKFYENNQTVGNAVLTRLALTLLRVSDADVYNALVKEQLDYWDETKSTVANSTCLDNVNKALVSLATAQKAEGADTKTLSGVKELLTENVYLNRDSSLTKNDTEKAYAASDFLTDISKDETRAWIYATVLEEIKYENFLLQKDGNTQNGGLTEEISKASVTRYILNWYLHRVMVKSQLKVLDLEPCYDYSDDTDKKLASLIRNAIGVEDKEDSKPTIDITQMSSAEFIGKIEDMNATYDVVYLGSRTGMMNTDSSGKTEYNDKNMKGLLFTHTGDYYTYNSKTESNETNRLRLVDDSLKSAKRSTGETNTYRIPGNDMNSTRFEEFKQYIDAGYPLILSDKYVTYQKNGNVTASTKTLDTNSYFYQLVQYALTYENGQYRYWQKNVFTEEQLTVSGDTYQTGTTLVQRRNVFCNYLNLSKLSVNWVTNLGEAYIPQDIHNGSTQQGTLNTSYLQPIDGRYQMQYIFTLKNDAALSPTATSYDCKLFIDNNADGRFSGSDYVEGKSSSSTEELAGLTIYRREGDNWVEENRVTVNGRERYELQTELTYKIVRALPEDYQGVLPWKLVFYDNSDPLVRTAKTGYTAVRIPSGGTVKILQLMSDREIEKYDKWGNLKSGSKERWNLQEDSEMEELFAEVKANTGFDVDVTSVYTSDFIKKTVLSGYTDSQIRALERKSDDAARQEYYNLAVNALQSYQMIILGFGDNYTFGKTGKTASYPKAQSANMALAEAVRDYIESGKSVLFTHDSSSYVNSTQTSGQTWYWGYEFNKTMRAAVGLDRFGALKEYYRDTDYYNVLTDNSKYQYDTIREPGQSTELNAKEGLTKYTVVRYLSNQLSNLKSGYSSVKFPINNDKLRSALDGSGLNGDYSGSDLIATEVNQGQITNYPYYIGESLNVATTHYQWMQPNMELDKDGDNKNDIVVWYCLSGVVGNSNNIYSLTPNDVVNNYYIYNMGNVTYSGAGHTKPANGSVEKKLFVNTMIAAYTAGTKAPSMSFLNSNGTSVDSVYMMYDRANKIVLQQESDVNVDFKANDYNILSSVPEIRVEFYKACGDGEEGALSVAGINGKVKAVNGLKIARASDGATVTAQTSDNVQYYVVSSDAVYHMSLPLSETGMFNISGSGSNREYTLKGTESNAVEPVGIYAKVTTYYDNGNQKTDSTIVKLSVSVADLFDLN